MKNLDLFERLFYNGVTSIYRLKTAKEIASRKPNEKEVDNAAFGEIEWL